ncbi:hypothetical protein D3C72_1834080 [compost metagenome]
MLTRVGTLKAPRSDSCWVAANRPGSADGPVALTPILRNWPLVWVLPLWQMLQLPLRELKRSMPRCCCSVRACLSPARKRS